MKQFFSRVWQGFLRCVWVLVKAIAMEGSAERDPDMVDPYETTWRNGPFSYTSAYTENEHSVGLFGRLWIDRRGKRLFKVYHNIHLSPRMLFYRIFSSRLFYRLCKRQGISEATAKTWWHEGGFYPERPFVRMCQQKGLPYLWAFLRLAVGAVPHLTDADIWFIFTYQNPNWVEGTPGLTFGQVLDRLEAQDSTIHYT